MRRRIDEALPQADRSIIDSMAFTSTSCLRIHRQKKKNPAPITQSSPMKLNISLRDLPSTTETNSCSKRLTSWSHTSNIRGEEQPSTSYWQKRRTGKSSKSVPKTQLTRRFFNCFNFIIHFSTCITSCFFKAPAHISIFSTATLTQIFFLSDSNNYFR